LIHAVAKGLKGSFSTNLFLAYLTGTVTMNRSNLSQQVAESSSVILKPLDADESIFLRFLKEIGNVNQVFPITDL